MSLPRESLPSSDATPTPPPAAAPSPEDPTALRPALKRDKLLAGLCLAALLVLHAVPGHLPGGVLLGLLLVLGATVGVLGLLGDSPLDLRGDERDAEADDDRPWYRREGVWVLLFGGALPPAGGRLRPVGPVGDALRRGGPGDPRARRLDHPVVGAGGLVHVQAHPHLLDERAGHGLRLALRACASSADAGPAVPGVVHPRPIMPARDRRDVCALPRRRARPGGARAGLLVGAGARARCRTGFSSRTRR
jgi:hypothetical protein